MSPADAPRDLIGPFVLGACTPEESAQVRAHMTASPSFRAEVEAFDVVHDALLEVPTLDVAPDAALKRSVMAQVQAEASLFAAAGPDERAALAREHDALPTPTAVAPVDGPDRGTGVPAPSPRRNAFLAALTNPARATALAAVLLALVVGGIVLGSGGGSDTREIPIQASPIAGNNASGRIVQAKDSSTLKLSGFPDAGRGKQYQVWLQSGTEDPKPTKVLFSVDAKGHGEATIPGNLDRVDQVLVTAEPKGGSPAPTSDPVLHAQV